MRSLVIFRFWLLELDSFTEDEAEVSLVGVHGTQLTVSMGLEPRPGLRPLNQSQFSSAQVKILEITSFCHCIPGSPVRY